MWTKFSDILNFMVKKYLVLETKIKKKGKIKKKSRVQTVSLYTFSNAKEKDTKNYENST